MASQESLQLLLEEILGSPNVYYQPPVGLMMNYDAIRYSKSNIQADFANNAIYRMKTRYELILICVDPDSPVIAKLLALPYCSYDRWYAADGLNHDVFTLYY